MRGLLTAGWLFKAGTAVELRQKRGVCSKRGVCCLSREKLIRLYANKRTLQVIFD